MNRLLWPLETARFLMAQDWPTIAGNHERQLLTLPACGHTHIPRSLHVDGCQIVNPGSVGLPAYDDDQLPHRVENGSPHARYALVAQAAEGWTVALHSVPYDHPAAAAKAQQENRPDWAHALQYGYVPAA
ncbi:MAG: hypothetical protein Q4A62_00620 [Eikenella sp.]|nr:hypothetical protein [Eikenella sp.]